ncbi:MAG: cation:proton antiporter [Porticoccus sp.]|jgi:Kef-type K+ transport system membrane component KefB|uniref:cation:proton antiporter domain-containing protein n=1 Tax=Porticoccus sp. Uisw_050_02 TaxID=3230978 RepID=UPI0030B7A329|tara:strand:- start:3868 stop:5034 length:1167 start_codon:yes stop_codon:yes gene_type:complete
MNEAVFQSFFFIFTGSAIVATIAIYGRQPLLVGYIALGVLIGPFGFGWVPDINLLSEISEIGIIFLLFLLGLDLQPQALVSALKKVTVVTFISSFIFSLIGYFIAHLFHYSPTECLVIGAAMMFSSTLICIKLLPTTVLHHRHVGEMIIGLLLMQDFLAIFVLLILLSSASGQIDITQIGLTLLTLPLLVLFAWGFVKLVLLKLIAKFDQMGEYIFLLSIGWCMGLSEIAEVLGLSREIGAFIAGITIASSPISQHIALKLKPLRDFFLIMFFFSVGAGFNLSLLPEVALAAAVLAVAMLTAKPVIFRFLLEKQSEKKDLAWDIGFRLGQISEFSLLIAYVAYKAAVIGELASHLIQATAIFTFLISSYIVIYNFPSPIATNSKLRRD